MRCELGLKETTGPTGDSQYIDYQGGPTNGRATACRRRLAASLSEGPRFRKTKESHWTPDGGSALGVGVPPPVPARVPAPQFPQQSPSPPPIASTPF